jgi:hypothetical protein
MLWLIRSGAVAGAVILPQPTDNMTGPVTLTGIVAGDEVGLTVEPTPQSHRPSSTMLIDLRL